MVPRPPPVASFSLCGLRLFVIKRICLSFVIKRICLSFGRVIPGRSYKAHWEVLGLFLLGCALCLLTARAIPRTGPVWGWGFCPGSRRPRARVPLVVWAWELFVMRLPCCGLPAPARRQFFALRSATVCHCTYLFSRLCLIAALCLSLFARLRVDAQLRSLGACRDVAVCHQFINEYCFCDRYRETRCVK